MATVILLIGLCTLVGVFDFVLAVFMAQDYSISQVQMKNLSCIRSSNEVQKGLKNIGRLKNKQQQQKNNLIVLLFISIYCLRSFGLNCVYVFTYIHLGQFKAS